MASRARPSRSARVLRWLAVAVLFAIALAYVHPLRTYRQAGERLASRRAEVAALERQKRELAERLAFARTDAFVEQEARKIGLVRRGERLYIVARSR